ncbi:MAG: hypothetical protein ACM31C_31975 [Acidobacteriota bacterium]
MSTARYETPSTDGSRSTWNAHPPIYTFDGIPDLLDVGVGAPP